MVYVSELPNLALELIIAIADGRWNFKN